MALIKTFLAKDPHLMLNFSAVAGWEILDNYRFYVAVDIREADGTTWTQVMAGEYTPDAAGVVKVNVKAALRGVFTPTPPNYNINYLLPEPLAEFNNTIMVFRTRSGGMTGTQVVPSSPTTTGEYLAILGGLSKYKFATMAAFFTSYLGTAKKFMSWAPLEKYVDGNQEDFLNFYFTAAPPAYTIRQRIKAYFDDGTTQTVTIVEQFVFTWGLNTQQWRFATGPLNSGVYTINPAKRLVKYETWLANNVNTALSEVRTYIIDPVTFPNKRLIMFLNSLGNWEVLRCYGDATEHERYQRQVVRKNLRPGYAGTDGEYQQTSVEGQPERVLRTGYFLETDSREWMLYMRDLMKSPKVFDVTTGSRIPLVITTTDLSGPESRNYKYAVGFEAIAAYSDEVYTPDNA